jgi:hypothetical protein
LAFTPRGTLVANFGVFRFLTGPVEIYLTSCRDVAPARTSGEPECRVAPLAAVYTGRGGPVPVGLCAAPRDVLPCQMSRSPSSVGRAAVYPPVRPLPPPVHAYLPRLLPYHGRDSVVPCVTKQASVAYLRPLRQPRVRHHPCLPELTAGRHSRRHRGAPPCVPFHARASCPTPSLVPTEAHPTALSLGRASTSPEQPLPRLAPGDATEHHRRHALRAVQPPEWNPR